MVSDNAKPATPSSGQRPSNTIENVTNDINKVDILKSELNAPTDSHALAHAEVEEASLIHTSPDDEATADIGWQQQPHEFDEPIIGGIPNEDLWMLIRRFNKVGVMLCALLNKGLTSIHIANISCQGYAYTPTRQLRS